jgi:hypothetical protein
MIVLEEAKCQYGAPPLGQNNFNNNFADQILIF